MNTHRQERPAISGEAMQQLLRAGRLERSRHLSTAMVAAGGALKTLVRRVIAAVVPASRPGDLSGRPA